MGKLWVPPQVSQQLRDTTAAHNRRLLDMFQLNDSVQSRWNPELGRLDPLLKLAKAKDGADDPQVKPGFWHLIRLNELAPFWVQPLMSPTGGFVEPTSQMLDLLRQSDLQNSRAVRARQALDQREMRERNAARAREDEQRQDELREQVAAVTRTQVSMNPDVPWSQNAAGAKRRHKAA
jgi:hypothetical protein